MDNLVTEIARTCLACPSQWEGKLSDGRELYARFRHGRFRIDIDDKEFYSTDELGTSEHDGFMTDPTMIKEAELHGFEFAPGCWKHELVTGFPEFPEDLEL